MTLPRVVIVGAGPAGVRAAEMLVDHGVRPVVVDEAIRAGGQIYRQPPDGFTRPARALYGFEATKARRLHGAFDALAPAIDYRAQTTVWNISGGYVHTQCDSVGDRIPFDSLILATGAMDRVVPFHPTASRRASGTSKRSAQTSHTPTRSDASCSIKSSSSPAASAAPAPPRRASR